MRKYINGDRVITPWGLDEVEGTVIDTFGPPGNPFVTVRIDLGDHTEASQSNDIGFRAADLRLADVARA